MKKILLGVAVAVAAVMMTGCPGLGINLDGNKYDATMKMDFMPESLKDASKIQMVKDSQWIEQAVEVLLSGKTTDTDKNQAKNPIYRRDYKQLGSLEKAEALTTTITVNLAESKLYNDQIGYTGTEGKRYPVWGFAFDYDTSATYDSSAEENKKYTPNNNTVDFCLVGMRKVDSEYQYYFERYTGVNATYNKKGASSLAISSSIGPYVHAGFDNSWGDTLYKNYDTESNGLFTGTKKTTDHTNASFEKIETQYYEEISGQTWKTNLYIVQDNGIYKVYIGLSETNRKHIGTFGKGSGSLVAGKTQGHDTNIFELKRYGPVSKNGNLMGGIACYASCPYNTKLSVHYDTPKESIQGAIFAQPVE